MKKTDLAYIAGIVDGEGYIRIAKYKEEKNKSGYKYQLRIGVNNTNEWLIHWLYFNFGGSIYLQEHRANNRKPLWFWYLASRKAQKFIELILPYLQLKRPQAELALEFTKRKHYRGKTDKERAIEEAEHILMRSYNKKGLKEK